MVNVIAWVQRCGYCALADGCDVYSFVLAVVMVADAFSVARMSVGAFVVLLLIPRDWMVCVGA